MAVRTCGVGSMLLAIMALLPQPLAAQEAEAGGHPWYVGAARWAKWPTLAAAVGLTAAAIVRKDDADQYFDQLDALCSADSDACRVGPGGGYLNPEAEALYQETLRLDAQARRWMIGGQGFLFVSGALFLIDLVAGQSKPKNIPFTPLEAYATPGLMGLRWRF
jgi:hypothetical protein